MHPIRNKIHSKHEIIYPQAIGSSHNSRTISCCLQIDKKKLIFQQGKNGLVQVMENLFRKKIVFGFNKLWGYCRKNQETVFLPQALRNNSSQAIQFYLQYVKKSPINTYIPLQLPTHRNKSFTKEQTYKNGINKQSKKGKEDGLQKLQIKRYKHRGLSVTHTLIQLHEKKQNQEENGDWFKTNMKIMYRQVKKTDFSLDKLKTYK